MKTMTRPQIEDALKRTYDGFSNVRYVYWPEWWAPVKLGYEGHNRWWRVQHTVIYKKNEYSFDILLPYRKYEWTKDAIEAAIMMAQARFSAMIEDGRG